MFALLCLQVSLLVQPQYFGQAPPELRSARNILLIVESPEAGLERARELRERIAAGASFEELAREHSRHANAARGAVLGNFAPGMLAEPLDRFLFAAEPGEVSEPLVTPGAVHLLQRIDTRAAVLQIFVAEAGEASSAKLAELQRALAQGADFEELAREHSEDPGSAARGGQFAIYERGTQDRLLKAAAFETPVGEVCEPVRTGLGYHLLKRVPLQDVDPALAERHWARFRAILVAHRATEAPDPQVGRSREEAAALIEELALDLEQGADFGELAAQHSDDPGARERRGDLGWIYRFAPGLDPLFDRAFLLRPGERSAPLPRPGGLLLFERSE